MDRPRSGRIRFLTVISLFMSIFWAFYSLNLRKIWRSQTWYEERRRELFVSQARRFRNTAVELGGLMIKLGQFFSTRVDVLPQAVTRELASLQDEVQPEDFAALRQAAETEFGRPLEEIYESLEETPLAAASLGQVHCGRLASGQTVAVKIQRPGIEELVDTDLKAVRRVIDLIKLLTDWEKYADFDAIFSEFSAMVHEELDYIHEGHNAEAIAANLADDREVIIPRIHWEHTTRRVLTMEFEEGMKITDYEGLARAGVNRHDLAIRLLHIYIKQILVDGFFHADPHPGNLFVTPAGRIILIDFGMVGVISRPLRENLVQLAQAMIQRNYDQVVNLLKKVGFLRRGADAELLAKAIGLFMEQVLGKGEGPVQQRPGRDYGQYGDPVIRESLPDPRQLHLPGPCAGNPPRPVRGSRPGDQLPGRGQALRDRIYQGEHRYVGYRQGEGHRYRQLAGGTAPAGGAGAPQGRAGRPVHQGIPAGSGGDLRCQYPGAQPADLGADLRLYPRRIRLPAGEPLPDRGPVRLRGERPAVPHPAIPKRRRAAPPALSSPAPDQARAKGVALRKHEGLM